MLIFSLAISANIVNLQGSMWLLGKRLVGLRINKVYESFKMAFSAATLQTLSYILDSYQFVIPDYQRGYAWKEPQWKALWGDLLNTNNSNTQQHFTGMMLLRPVEKIENLFEVVDGQQRLITVMTLANVLRSKVKIQPVRYRLKFIDNEDLTNFFGVYTNQEPIATRLNRESASSYALNIEEANRYFGTKVQELNDQEVRNLLATLLNKFGLFVLEVTPHFDIHIAFETLNNRGRMLSKMELLKNRLIYLTTIIKHSENESPEELRQHIHSTWKHIYRWLGRNQRMQIVDDEFLLAHSTAYFKRENKAGWLEDILLEKTFAVLNKELNHELIRNYLGSLETGVAWWSHLHLTEHLPSSHQKVINKIERSNFAYFKPLLLAAYMRVSENDNNIVTRPFDYEDLLDPVLKLLQEIERYIVVVFRLIGKMATYERAGIYSCTYWLLKSGRHGWKLLDELEIKDLDGTESIGLITDYIKSIVHNPINEDGEYSDSRFPWPGVFNIDSVKKSIDERFNDADGFYKWDFTKLVLVEYEESFHRDGKSPVKCGWNEFSFEETVEHIYPQTPTGKGVEYWKKFIPIDGRANKTGKLSKAVQNSLGNLLFLSRSDNSSVSNGPFNAPNNEACKKKSFENSSYSGTEVSKFKDWNINAIAVRGIQMIQFIESRWKIELSSIPVSHETYLNYLFGSDSEKIISGKAGKLNMKSISQALQNK